MSRIPLPDNEAHLWIVKTDDLHDPTLLEAYAELQTDQEKKRWKRYLVEPARHQHLVARALCRTTLSRYAEVDPVDWRFESGPKGKPFIAQPSPDLDLRFNLSHTGGCIICLVALGLEVGADVENRERREPPLDIADRWFSPSEVHELRALPHEHQLRRFFDYWTLKEAYIKARGLGLSLPLDQFSFDLTKPESIGIAFDPKLEDDPNRWQFQRIDLGSRHPAAIAIEREDRPDLTLRLFPCTPLRDEGDSSDPPTKRDNSSL